MGKALDAIIRPYLEKDEDNLLYWVDRALPLAYNSRTSAQVRAFFAKRTRDLRKAEQHLRSAIRLLAGQSSTQPLEDMLLDYHEKGTYEARARQYLGADPAPEALKLATDLQKWSPHYEQRVLEFLQQGIAALDRNDERLPKSLGRYLSEAQERKRQEDYRKKELASRQLCMSVRGIDALFMAGRDGKPNKKLPFTLIYDTDKGDPAILQWLLYAREYQPERSPFAGRIREKGSKLEVEMTLEDVECVYASYEYREWFPKFMDLDPKTAPHEHSRFAKALKHCSYGYRKNSPMYAQTSLHGEKGAWHAERKTYDASWQRKVARIERRGARPSSGLWR